MGVRERDDRAPVIGEQISRAKNSAAFYADTRTDLLAAHGARDGAQIGALDEALTRHGPGAALDGPA